MRGFIFPKNQPDVERSSARGQLGNYFMKSDKDVSETGYVKLIIDYTTSVNAASGQIWDIDGARTKTEQWQVNAFDSNNILLSSQLSPLGNSYDLDKSLNGAPWIWNFREEGIRKIEVEFVGTKMEGAGLAFDNFSPTALTPIIPEPATMSIIGAAGIGYLLKKRSSQKSA